MNENYNFFMKANLEEHIGKWIAIDNNKIIASGKDVGKVIKKAKKTSPKKSLLFQKFLFNILWNFSFVL